MGTAEAKGERNKLGFLEFDGDTQRLGARPATLAQSNNCQGDATNENVGINIRGIHVAGAPMRGSFVA